MADTDTATATPDTLAPMENPGLTDMIPYQGSPESVDVNTPNPQSPELQQTPDLTATIPSETAPNNPDIERQYHEAWWRHALDKVGTMLGGDTTIHVTKDKDGNVTMTHDPSTTGEKWGRVAAAALSGAAAGLANAQGPGGLLKATAAGTQAGLQLPQQREQQAQQSVDFQNKQLLAKANRIYVTQHAYLAAQQAKQAELEHTEETVKAMNADYDAADQSPNSIKVGTTDPSEKDAIIKLAQQNPAAMDAYLHKGNQRFRFVARPDNKVDVFLTDRSWEEQMNDQPATIKKLDTDDKGNPILTTRIAQPGTVRNGEAYNHNTATTTAYLGQKKTKADADKAEADAQKALNGPADKPLDSSGKTLDAWRLEPDPTKKAELWTQYQQQLKDEKALKEKPEAGTWIQGEDEAGNPILYNNKTAHVMDAPDGIRKAGTKAKQDAAIDKATRPAKDAMEYATLYMTQGQQNPKSFTGSGDEALMDKYFELAKPSSGFRMSGPQQNMLLNARSWIGSAQGRAYHAIHGTWFAPDQRKEIVNTMGNLAAAKGIPPPGGGAAAQPQIPPGRFPVYVNGTLVGHSRDKAGNDYQDLTPPSAGGK